MYIYQPSFNLFKPLVDEYFRQEQIKSVLAARQDRPAAQSAGAESPPEDATQFDPFDLADGADEDMDPAETETDSADESADAGEQFFDGPLDDVVTEGDPLLDFDQDLGPDDIF